MYTTEDKKRVKIEFFFDFFLASEENFLRKVKLQSDAKRFQFILFKNISNGLSKRV